MTWDEIREHYPHQWLLIEAVKAFSESGRRIIEQFSVINIFPDSVTAMQNYKQLHRELPEREIYVFHTDLKKIEISERNWLGIRGIQ